jgi:hypothetical protein
MRQHRWFRYSVVSAVALLVYAPIWPGSSSVQTASASTAPEYHHSWYIVDPSSSAMENLAASDAQWSNAHCGSGGFDGLVILDFGQPGYYGSYGTYYFAYNAPFISDAAIIKAVEQYIIWWWNDTTPCPYLHVAIGTNNYHECPFGSPCNIYTAGEQWANITNTVSAWVKSQGYSVQVAVWSADDIETGWDPFSCSGCKNTADFVNGYNANNSCGCNLGDFGDAWANPNWTESDVYYVAWGEGYDIPFPEIYSQYAANRWAQVKKDTKNGIQGIMIMYGVTTECSGSDPLPSANCYVSGNNDYEFAPNQAWNALMSAMSNDGVGQSTIPYATNIQYQP